MRHVCAKVASICARSWTPTTVITPSAGSANCRMRYAGKAIQLRFVKAPQHSPATNLFWEAHRSSGREITAVCDPLLFFHDFPNGKLFRFVDTNIEEPSRNSGRAEKPPP